MFYKILGFFKENVSILVWFELFSTYQKVKVFK